MKFAALINTIIATVSEEYEVVTTSTGKTSHGKTTATTITTVRRKKAETPEEPAKQEPWLVEAIGWQPADCRRSDGCKEMWGKPRISMNGDISVPVRVVDGDVTVNEYTMSLTITVRDQVKMCLRQARLDIIQGRNPWVPLDVQRARKLLAHHANERAWEDLRSKINGLYKELNDIAAAAAASTATRVECLKAELQQARKTNERVKALRGRSHSSEEWARAIAEALAERLGGDANDIRIARDVAEKKLRESDAED